MADKQNLNMELKFASNMEDPSILLMLQSDPRPTFAVDTATNARQADSVYVNPALRADSDLMLCLNSGWARDDAFTSWAGSKTASDPQHRFGGVLWTGFLVASRWRVVFANNGLDASARASKTTISSRLVDSWAATYTASASERVPYQSIISQLQEQVRTLKLDNKVAAQERVKLEKTILKLESHSRPSGGDTPQRNLFHRTRSYDRPYRTLGRETNSLLPDVLDQPSIPDIPDSKPISKPLVTESDPVSAYSSSGNDVEGESFLALQMFVRLSEMADVGFFDFDTNGKLIYANESWYALSGHTRDPELHASLSFLNYVHPDDKDIVMTHWNTLIGGHPVTFEMRWKKESVPGADPVLASDSQWVLAACVPVLDGDGKVRSISGFTTNINSQKLTADVALQRAEALERARASETRFAKFAAVAPIAIFRFDKHKNMEFCNDRWFDMTGIPKMNFAEVAYPFGVLNDDIAVCTAAWDRAAKDKTIGTVEFRLRKEWHDAHGRHGHTWVYCTFFPELADDGTLYGLMGSMLDISHIKWAENMQKIRAEDALEAKRQQEAFIDVTSHEMRNPLSAMVQCADSIMSSLTDIDSRLDSTTKQFSAIREDLHNSLDAASTILSCAAHQKRIVDDVLTMSKLDSNLLLITPVKASPTQMTSEVIKIFEADCKNADIQLRAIHDKSLSEMTIDWLMLDPSRVVQVLINLLTNAIKFTRDAIVRQITIKVSVSTRRPSEEGSTIEYVSADTSTDRYGSGIDWGEGEVVFLYFEVQDTGRGLTGEEKDKLFMRFSQASPKTHVQYGGSGLGLFISRRLTEMQGGEIGLASTPQVGSTFAFYVKARRTTGPTTGQEPSRSSSHQNSPSPALASSESHFHVLLVEDNLVNQRVLKQQLVKLGCHVHVAGHGVEALEFLETTNLWSTRDHEKRLPLDIVLMDVEMPIMGGLECTKRIRKLEQNGSIRTRLPIISISANARAEQVKDARLAGVDDTITKPFRINELLPKIQRLVR